MTVQTWELGYWINAFVIEFNKRHICATAHETDGDCIQKKSTSRLGINIIPLPSVWFASICSEKSATRCVSNDKKMRIVILQLSIHPYAQIKTISR